jgi:hypothetical protein
MQEAIAETTGLMVYFIVNKVGSSQPETIEAEGGVVIGDDNEESCQIQ